MAAKMAWGLLTVLGVMVLCACGTAGDGDGVRPVHLRCEYLKNPLGIDVTGPQLSWRIDTAERGQRQTASRILVASSRERLDAGDGDLWDSGKVAGDQSIHVIYEGTPLDSRKRCWWKVHVWDRDGEPGPWSEPATWEMGLLEPSDWTAEWISAPPPDSPRESTERPELAGWRERGLTAGGEELVEPAPYFRKEFTLDKPVARARARITGLGYYELFLNGGKVGNRLLDPALTPYDHRVFYVTYDIGGKLKDGVNAVGVILGNGFYNMAISEWGGFSTIEWRGRPTVHAQLEITYEDGSTAVIVTDGSWRVTREGPLRFDGLKNGEIYDARRVMPGWSNAGFDDSDWERPVVVDGPAGRLDSMLIPPVKVMRTLSPVSVSEPEPGVFVFDFGQNMAGIGELTVSGPAGTAVTMRYGERLYDDGTLNTEESDRGVSGRFQTDTYILGGDGGETWRARFAYHGFQYIEMTGFPGTPDLDTVRAHVVHTAFDTIGSFSCSNELFNRIHECTRWSYVSNFVGNPTDCPQREKNGWTGDGHIAGETGLYNFTAAPGYSKWIDDFRGEQRPDGEVPAQIPNGGGGFVLFGGYPNREAGFGPAWNSTYIIIPWYLYLYRGDKTILADHYEEMKAYLSYLDSWAKDGLCPIGLGDWVQLDQETETVVTSTAYYYYDALLMSRIARILGKEDDSRMYSDKAETIREAFNRAFYRPEEGSYANGTQTALSTALYHGLVEPENIDAVVNSLVENIAAENWHLNVGLLGSKYLFNALTEYGHGDVAWRIANQRDYPSYGWWIELGATTLWEDWPGERSRNHIMFGEIDAWFYRCLAGIRPMADHPGFKRFTVKPHLLGDLTHVEAETASLYGTIRSAWSIDNDRYTHEVTVPPNTQAVVHVPCASPGDVTESGSPAQSADGVAYQEYGDGYAVFLVESGTYRFACPRE